MATIPSLALIPSGYKASKVYSVLPTDGTGDFTFTRSGNATRVNSEGLIELVSTNVPRLNYPLIDGVVQGCPSLLLEPQRTNLILYSEYNSSNFSIGANLTFDGYVTSPEGVQNAARFTSSASTISFIQIPNVTIPVGKFTFSMYVRGVSGSFTNTPLYIPSFTGSSATMNEVPVAGEDWKRVYGTGENTGSSVTRTITLPFYDQPSGTTYEVYGFQLEGGGASYATSYIPTSGTTATRSAETCNNAGDVNTFNDSEGVLMLESNFLSESLSTAVIAISDGTPSNRIILGYFGGNSQLYCQSIGGVSAPTSMSFTVSDVTLNSKILIKYKEDDFAFWVNGFKIAVRNSGTVPSGLSELAFDSGGGLSNLYGNTKQIQYFNTALNDSDLETLTSWTSFSEMATSQLYTIE
jgi:hypothetical protein